MLKTKVFNRKERVPIDGFLGILNAFKLDKGKADLLLMFDCHVKDVAKLLKETTEVVLLDAWVQVGHIGLGRFLGLIISTLHLLLIQISMQTLKS